MTPKVFILTLNWNNTINLLKSIKKIDYPNYKIVVIDNGSTDDSVKVIKEEFADVKIIENKKNLGYCEGYNVGIRYALFNKADYIIVTNNDCTVDKDYVKELVKIAESDKNIGLVSGKVYFYDRKNVLQAIGGKVNWLTGFVRIKRNRLDNGQFDDVKEVMHIDDVFLLVRPSLVKKIGMYDKDFFIYYEETDLCARAIKSGFKIVYTPFAKIWHKEHASTGGGRSKLATFYLIRNRIIFMKKNASKLNLIIFLFLLLIIAPLQLVYYLFRGYFNIIIPYIKGLYSGLVWLLNKKVLLHADLL